MDESNLHLNSIYFAIFMKIWIGMGIRNPILFATVACHISKLSISLLRIVARLFLIYHLENSVYSRDIAIFLPEEYRDLYQMEIDNSVSRDNKVCTKNYKRRPGNKQHQIIKLLEQRKKIQRRVAVNVIAHQPRNSTLQNWHVLFNPT